MLKRMAWVAAFVLAAAAAAGVLATRRAREGVEIAWGNLVSRVGGPYTIADRLGQFGERARARLAVSFASGGVTYPPADTAWLAFKDARVLEVHARAAAGPWRLLAQYPILGASGRAGPKLREGDQQVPEGAYRIELLNPNSRYHVSMRLDYPNAFDRRMAARDGRTNLGGDIMIHGKSCSIGCLAMGDEAAEELFTLAADTGIEHVTVIVSPTDFRRTGVPAHDGLVPPWTADLYSDLAKRLAPFGLSDRGSR